jgi:sorting nexin-3/12
VTSVTGFFCLFSTNVQIVVPPLPGKAWKRQLPFRGDDGIYEEEFIEDRKQGLELFINK